MAQGFADTLKTTEDKKEYQTLFETISEKSGGEKKSYSWYRNAISKEISKFKVDKKKFVRDEIRDSSSKKEYQDENVLRRYAIEGHLYLFQYKTNARLPYYDQYPLVYVVKSNPTEFWGANLHYMSPKKRILAIRELRKERIDLPKICFHKYLKSNVQGYLLDLAADEWSTAILLPIEDFVIQVKGGNQFQYEKELVWKETNDKFYDKIKSHRVIKGYGTKESREMAK
jgi:hypothetical protein